MAVCYEYDCYNDFHDREGSVGDIAGGDVVVSGGGGGGKNRNKDNGGAGNRTSGGKGFDNSQFL